MKTTKKLITVLFAILLIAGLLGTTAFAVDTDLQNVQGAVQSTTGAPIADAEVVLIDMDARKIVATTESDSSGAFNFTGSFAGEYMVAVTANGYVAATVPVAEDSLYVELTPAPMSRARSAAPTGLLMVFVMDPDFAMITNATATFNGAAMHWDGMLFQMNVVPGQAGALNVQAPGFQPNTTAVTAADFIGSFAMINIVMEPGFRLPVRVLCQWDDCEIAGANLTLMPVGAPLGRLPIPGGPTNANGEYLFDMVPGGMWMLTAEADGFSPGLPVMINVPMAGGGMLPLQTVRLNPIITAEVLDARDDTPIAGATVTLMSDNPGPGFHPVATGTTDANGLFHFVGQPAGTYFFVAEAVDFITASSESTNCGATLTVRLEPEDELPGLPFIAIAEGRWHTLGLRADGTVWAWGSNWEGQLGDGTTIERYTPVQVHGGATGDVFLSNVRSIAVGWSHSVAVREDGTVWAWGSNGAGQLGDGTTINRYTPVQVHGGETGDLFLSNVQVVFAYENTTMAWVHVNWWWWAWGEWRLPSGGFMQSSLPVFMADGSGDYGRHYDNWLLRHLTRTEIIVS